MSDHLAEKEIFPNPLNVDLSRGFTVSRVAEKHNWPPCKAKESSE